MYVGVFSVDFIDTQLGDIDTQLGDVSHKIEELYIKEDGVYCDIKILKTQKGKELITFIESGITPIFRFNISFKESKFKFHAINVIIDENYDYFDMKQYYRLKKINQLLNK